MADPHRWRLLNELARSDRRVSELTQLLNEPQSLVSYHLAELRDSGLVSSRRSSFDGRDAYYRIDLARCAGVLCAAAAALDPALTLSLAPPSTSRVRRRRPRVLFLCTGNSARSQMAEALLEQRSDHTIEARSAGSHPKALHPNAVRVMAARGVDISGHTSKHLDRFARARFDRVITLCDKVREVCPEFPGPPATAHWSIPDPAAAGRTNEDSYPAFEAVAADLEVRVGHLIACLTTPEGGRAHA
jgi:ArsR family transcriptional regulator, arsenate/arsenite/antimonite-responsive transcriptional repressor / arsenate reductase (thioredoxin)